MPLRNQPRGQTQINRSHPWARYIKGAWVFNRPDFRNIADPYGPASTRNGTLPLQSYPGGVCVSGVSGGRIDTPYTASQLGIDGSRKRVVLFQYLHPAGYAGPATILSLGGTNSGGNEFCVRIISATQIQLGGFYADSNFTVTSSNVDHVVQVALMYDGSTLTCYSIATGTDGATRYTSSNGSNLSTSNDHALSFLNATFDHFDQFTSQLHSVTILSDYSASSSEVERYFSNTNAIFDAGSSNSAYQSAIASATTAAGANGNATIIGASSNSAVGLVTGSGNARSSLTGNSASALSGAVTAGGNAVTSVSGAQASGNAGTVTPSGSANASMTGVQAAGQTGAVTASSAASGTATVSGAAASGQSGSILAAGNATTAPSGVSASGQSGVVIASAGSAGTATVSGVASSAQTGSATASGSASTLPVGQMASAQTGTVVAIAGGNANVALTGIAALVQAGTIIAKGNGLAMLAGTTVNGMTGQPSGSGSSQTLLYGAVAYGQSGQASAIGGNGNASVSILGAGAAALVGQVSAAFIPSSIGINITEDMLCKAVRSYILSIRPTQRVIRTPVNLASMPDGPYVSFTPGRRMPLSTNVASYLSGSRSVERAEQMGFQIDCYGEGARDLADTINLLFRDQYAIDQLAQSGLDIAPLYAGDVMQMPFVDDSDQYEERYSFEIFLQINSVVITPQQSCNMLGINILPVETTYPIV